jgi:hypothetical protein
MKKNKFTAFQWFLFSYRTRPGDVKFFVCAGAWNQLALRSACRAKKIMP